MIWSKQMQRSSEAADQRGSRALRWGDGKWAHCNGWKRPKLKLSRKGQAVFAQSVCSDAGRAGTEGN
jgi:hypothetical protein